MGVHIAMHAMQCVNVGALWECTWPQSILDQDPLTGHHPPPMGDTLPSTTGFAKIISNGRDYSLECFRN